MTLEPIDPASHDYAAEEARIDAWAARHARPILPPRHRAAYEEFWPQLAELLGEHL